MCNQSNTPQIHDALFAWDNGASIRVVPQYDEQGQLLWKDSGKLSCILFDQSDKQELDIPMYKEMAVRLTGAMAAMLEQVGMEPLDELTRQAGIKIVADGTSNGLHVVSSRVGTQRDALFLTHKTEADALETARDALLKKMSEHLPWLRATSSKYIRWLARYKPFGAAFGGTLPNTGTPATVSIDWQDGPIRTYRLHGENGKIEAGATYREYTVLTGILGGFVESILSYAGERYPLSQPSLDSWLKKSEADGINQGIAILVERRNEAFEANRETKYFDQLIGTLPSSARLALNRAEATAPAADYFSWMTATLVTYTAAIEAARIEHGAHN